MREEKIDYEVERKCQMKHEGYGITFTMLSNSVGFSIGVDGTSEGIFIPRSLLPKLRSILRECIADYSEWNDNG